jgi:GH25 family lysozyme M1 (1,4-beta-N-acetylmuramidase)
LLKPIDLFFRAVLTISAAALFGAGLADASDFSEPWKRADRALVVDAYEYNAIDWPKLVRDKRVVGFINKGSDGLSPPYRCSGNETEVRLCKALWKRHAVARELFHTRRTVAKALGLKWGAYHLARPGNPIDQANNFIDFTEPAPDDLIALDIEENDPQKWMSLEDAEIFARHIHARLGRWPVLYTNGSTALHIAENRERYALLSRLPLWYARYKPTIGLHFPKGNWETYTLWQFAAGANCDARSCPYRVPGTPLDIDVNVASMSAAELRSAWPFGELVEEKASPSGVKVAEPAGTAEADRGGETVPVPVARRTALEGGDVTVQFAQLDDSAAPASLALQGEAVEKARTLVPDEIVELTGETVPLPIPRDEAKKKRGDIALKFVAVERVLPADALPQVLTAAASPFQALLGKQAEPAVPIVLTNYVEETEKLRRLHAKASMVPQGAIEAPDISTAALDEAGPNLSSSRFSRRDLPMYLLHRLDGADQTGP